MTPSSSSLSTHMSMHSATKMMEKAKQVFLVAELPWSFRGELIFFFFSQFCNVQEMLLIFLSFLFFSFLFFSFLSVSSSSLVSDSERITYFLCLCLYFVHVFG